MKSKLSLASTWRAADNVGHDLANFYERTKQIEKEEETRLEISKKRYNPVYGLSLQPMRDLATMYERTHQVEKAEGILLESIKLIRIGRSHIHISLLLRHARAT